MTGRPNQLRRISVGIVGAAEYRLERVHLVKVDAGKSADTRFAPHGRWFNGEAGDADNPVATTESINNFYRLGTQANDSRRIILCHAGRIAGGLLWCKHRNHFHFLHSLQLRRSEFRWADSYKFAKVVDQYVPKWNKPDSAIWKNGP